MVRLGSFRPLNSYNSPERARDELSLIAARARPDETLTWGRVAKNLIEKGSVTTHSPFFVSCSLGGRARKLPF